MAAADIRRTLNLFPRQNWIVWVGAGISCPVPSNLPLGLPLLTYAMDEVFGQPVTRRLKDIWSRANNIAGTPVLPEPFGPGPRLETVLGIVEIVQQAQLVGRFDFLSGLRSFREAPFNLNHVYLAALIHQGVTVVTTNFDTCIQKAYQSLIAPTAPLWTRKHGNVYSFANSASRTGTLWHIHGVADDTPSLGATIRSVKQGLSPEFATELEKKLSGNALLIFAGYGAGDSFDITPFFSHRGRNQFSGSCALFLQHGAATAPPGAEKLLQPFGRGLIEHGDTTVWLREMSGNIGTPGAMSAVFRWQDVFRAGTELTDLAHVRSFAICRLARELGLSYERLDKDAYQQALATTDRFERWEFHRTLAFNCRMRRKARRERAHDRQAGDTDLLGYHYSKGNLRRAHALAKSLDRIQVDSADPSVELDWSIYTSFSAHVRPFVLKYVNRPFGRRVAPADIADGRRLLEIADELAVRPLKNVAYLNQVATAMRFSLLLRALLDGEGGEEVEMEILSLYGEASSIQGYVSAYRDLALKRLLLVRYHGKRDALKEAASLIRKSSELAKLVGDKDSARRAVFIGNVGRLYRVLS